MERPERNDVHEKRKKEASDFTGRFLLWLRSGRPKMGVPLPEFKSLARLWRAENGLARPADGVDDTGVNWRNPEVPRQGSTVTVFRCMGWGGEPLHRRLSYFGASSTAMMYFSGFGLSKFRVRLTKGLETIDRLALEYARESPLRSYRPGDPAPDPVQLVGDLIVLYMAGIHCNASDAALGIAYHNALPERDEEECTAASVNVGNRNSFLDIDILGALLLKRKFQTKYDGYYMSHQRQFPGEICLWNSDTVVDREVFSTAEDGECPPPLFPMAGARPRDPVDAEEAVRVANHYKTILGSSDAYDAFMDTVFGLNEQVNSDPLLQTGGEWELGAEGGVEFSPIGLGEAELDRIIDKWERAMEVAESRAREFPSAFERDRGVGAAGIGWAPPAPVAVGAGEPPWRYATAILGLAVVAAAAVLGGGGK